MWLGARTELAGQPPPRGGVADDACVLAMHKHTFSTEGATATPQVLQVLRTPPLPL